MGRLGAGARRPARPNPVRPDSERQHGRCGLRNACPAEVFAFRSTGQSPSARVAAASGHVPVATPHPVFESCPCFR